MTRFALRGNTALVTGAAKRLGRLVALALADEGVDVVVHYRSSADEADATRAEIEALGVKAWCLQADLADSAAAARVIDDAVALAGPLDILVNSAATFDASTLDDLQLTDLHASLALNAWAPFVLSRRFAAQSRAFGAQSGARAAQSRPGRIVNMIDTMVTGYSKKHVAYLLSKQILASLTRMMALEYAPEVTVNAVAPGLVLAPEGVAHSYLEHLAERLPLGRPGEPGDVVDAILYLVKAAYVTGQVIYPDGGGHLHR